MEPKKRTQDVFVAIFLVLFVIETTSTEPGRTLARDIKLKYLKKLSDNFYKYTRFGNKPKIFLTRGWSAGGMPFNVLYTPNASQQKILKSVPAKPTEIGTNRKILKEPKSYNLVLEEGKTQRKPLPFFKKHSKPRKYYSRIPHFFASYGW